MLIDGRSVCIQNCHNWHSYCFFYMPTTILYLLDCPRCPATLKPLSFIHSIIHLWNRYIVIKVFCIGIMSALYIACEKEVDGRRHDVCDVCDRWQHRLCGTGISVFLSFFLSLFIYLFVYLFIFCRLITFTFVYLFVYIYTHQQLP